VFYGEPNIVPQSADAAGVQDICAAYGREPAAEDGAHDDGVMAIGIALRSAGRRGLGVKRGAANNEV